jgi:ubiquinone/menaquinone biosynthesis C-methylase UbiE
MEAINTMTNSERAYIPAAGYDLFLPLYDLITKLMGMNESRNALLAWAELKPEHRVLDVGCGTGSLVIQLRRQHPNVEVIGLDPDPKALARARRKAQSAAVSVQFDQGFSHALGYPSASFDRVFSSFMFHHLPHGEREKTLGEIYRILKPGGRLLLLDFEGQESGKHHVLSTLLHKHASLNENSESRILGLMTDAGFTNAKKLEARTVLMGLGQTGYYQASVPNSGRS